MNEFRFVAIAIPRSAYSTTKIKSFIFNWHYWKECFLVENALHLAIYSAIKAFMFAFINEVSIVFILLFFRFLALYLFWIRSHLSCQLRVEMKRYLLVDIFVFLLILCSWRVYFEIWYETRINTNVLISFHSLSLSLSLHLTNAFTFPLFICLDTQKMLIHIVELLANRQTKIKYTCTHTQAHPHLCCNRIDPICTRSNFQHNCKNMHWNIPQNHTTIITCSEHQTNSTKNPHSVKSHETSHILTHTERAQQNNGIIYKLEWCPSPCFDYMWNDVSY